ncbi:MAG: molybdate ABC transporter substrate-binding protein, partial [Gammaproteobacteria bacterium]|nr:molybdate ABC transporter substrate-binding protein [Gammaproteobacteria bacterium]
ANTGHRISLANPRLAPYGLAASEVIANLGLADRLAGRLVMGENVSQAYQFVATGNAALGFVALSQVGGNAGIARGSGWLIPVELHSPIRQYAVLLDGGNTAARDFLEFLHSPEARRIIASFGYDLDD